MTTRRPGPESVSGRQQTVQAALRAVDARYIANGEKCARCGKTLGGTDAVCYTCSKALWAEVFVTVGAVEANAVLAAVADGD